MVPGGATRLAAGNRLNNAPEWSGSGSAVYEFATGRAGTASVRGDVSWQSQVFFTPVNDAIETQRAYGLVHLRAGFEPPSRRWEIAVYVRNAGNQEYITGTANVPLPAFTAVQASRACGARSSLYAADAAAHRRTTNPPERVSEISSARRIPSSPSNRFTRLTARSAGEPGN